MNELDLLYYRSKNTLLNFVPSYWPDMRLLCDDFIDSDLLPEIITPAACCKAVGGKIEDTVGIGAAILSAEISVRLLDDLTDQDKPDALCTKIGIARTLNYVDAFRTVAYKILTDKSLVDRRYLEITEAFTDCYLVVLAGQERDLKLVNKNFEEAWKTIEMKTGYIYATTALMGAMAGTNNIELIEGCKEYGYHLGLAIQIFNDMDGVWSPEGLSDLEQGKITLPLLYALKCEHKAKQELEKIVQQGNFGSQSERIKEILEDVDAKSYMVWMALKQREEGLRSINCLPDNGGKEMLEAHFTGMFGDIDQLVASNNELDVASRTKYKALNDTIQSNVRTTIQSDKNTVSEALTLRKKLRREFI